MDGNGRWAKQRDLPRLEGHKAGAESVRKVIEECISLGIEYLTLFTFSTENWGRAKGEVNGLMSLLKAYLDTELPELIKNEIRLHAVGDLDRLGKVVRVSLNKAVEHTRKNTKLNLVLAISYGGREEIVAAAKEIALKVAKKIIDPDLISNEDLAAAMWTKDLPDPDLLIRTSGEMRISNFLLWQVAYSEIVVAPELWPDFDEHIFRRCVNEYMSRERRFGLTTDQLEEGMREGNGESYYIS